MAKSRPKWQGWLQAGPAHQESVWCAISHPNTWESITWGHFHHFQAPIQGSRGPKMAILWLNPGPNGRGGSRLDWSTWKVSGAPYHTPSHGRASLRAIFAISRHLSRGPGVQMAGVAPGWTGLQRNIMKLSFSLFSVMLFSFSITLCCIKSGSHLLASRPHQMRADV